MRASELFMLIIALLIPVIGFVMTINHAKGADTPSDARWRKRHGVMFWVLIPSVAGILTVLGLLEMAPGFFSFIGIVLLLVSASVSMLMQKGRAG